MYHRLQICKHVSLQEKTLLPNLSGGISPDPTSSLEIRRSVYLFYLKIQTHTTKKVKMLSILAYAGGQV